MKVIYISGPIKGVPDYKRAFNKVENELQVQGFTVLNPAKLPYGLSEQQYMRINFAQIDAADAVVLLPDWDKSKGASLEASYCLYTGKPVYFSVEGLLKEVTAQ